MNRAIQGLFVVSVIIGIGIGVFNFEWAGIHHHATERLKIAERCHDFRSGIAVHPGLILDVHHGHDSTLQSAVLAHFDLLQEPLVAIHLALVRNLRTELRVRELGEEEFLILRLAGKCHLPRNRSTRVRGERRRDQGDGCYTKHH